MSVFLQLSAQSFWSWLKTIKTNFFSAYTATYILQITLNLVQLLWLFLFLIQDIIICSNYFLLKDFTSFNSFNQIPFDWDYIYSILNWWLKPWSTTDFVVIHSFLEDGTSCMSWNTSELSIWMPLDKTSVLTKELVFNPIESVLVRTGTNGHYQIIDRPSYGFCIYYTNYCDTIQQADTGESVQSSTSASTSVDASASSKVNGSGSNPIRDAYDKWWTNKPVWNRIWTVARIVNWISGYLQTHWDASQEYTSFGKPANVGARAVYIDMIEGSPVFAKMSLDTWLYSVGVIKNTWSTLVGNEIEYTPSEYRVATLEHWVHETQYKELIEFIYDPVVQKYSMPAFAKYRYHWFLCRGILLQEIPFLDKVPFLNNVPFLNQGILPIQIGQVSDLFNQPFTLESLIRVHYKHASIINAMNWDDWFHVCSIYLPWIFTGARTPVPILDQLRWQDGYDLPWYSLTPREFRQHFWSHHIHFLINTRAFAQQDLFNQDVLVPPDPHFNESRSFAPGGMVRFTPLGTRIAFWSASISNFYNAGEFSIKCFIIFIEGATYVTDKVTSWLSPGVAATQQSLMEASPPNPNDN